MPFVRSQFLNAEGSSQNCPGAMAPIEMVEWTRVAISPPQLNNLRDSSRIIFVANLEKGSSFPILDYTTATCHIFMAGKLDRTGV